MPELLPLHPPEEAHFSCLSGLLSAHGRREQGSEHRLAGKLSSFIFQFCIAAEAAPILPIDFSLFPTTCQQDSGILNLFQKSWCKATTVTLTSNSIIKCYKKEKVIPVQNCQLYSILRDEYEVLGIYFFIYFALN